MMPIFRFKKNKWCPVALKRKRCKWLACSEAKKLKALKPLLCRKTGNKLTALEGMAWDASTSGF
jgi:hypothetical protein